MIKGLKYMKSSEVLKILIINNNLLTYFKIVKIVNI